jgi:hypothetical protein
LALSVRSAALSREESAFAARSKSLARRIASNALHSDLNYARDASQTQHDALRLEDKIKISRHPRRAALVRLQLRVIIFSRYWQFADRVVPASRFPAAA